jgi:hypothetical protein
MGEEERLAEVIDGGGAAGGGGRGPAWARVQACASGGKCTLEERERCRRGRVFGGGG